MATPATTQPAPTNVAPTTEATPVEGATTAPAQGAEQPAFTEGQLSALRAVVRDAINADARRAVVPTKKATTTAPAPTSEATPPPNIRALDRAIARAGRSNLSDAAYARIERAFTEESPEDATAWLADYFADFGAGGSPQNTTATASQPAAPAAPANARPASDRGTPPAPHVPLEERDIATMTAADKQAVIASKGIDWYVRTLTAQQANKVVLIK